MGFGSGSKVVRWSWRVWKWVQSGEVVLAGLESGEVVLAGLEVGPKG